MIRGLTADWQPKDIIQPLLFLASAYLLYHITHIVYNVWFHPLAKFPGPALRSMSDVPWIWSLWSGNDPFNIKKLHDRYGSVVRIGPNRLCFDSAQAWKDIYGFKHGGAQIPKDLNFYLADNPHAPRSLINADDEDHARMRRLVAHAFSATALREQQSIIDSHCDLLLSRFAQSIGPSGSAKVDVTDWMMAFTFDVVADLSLGRSFGMLEKDDVKKFVAELMNSAGILLRHFAARVFPVFGLLYRSYLQLPVAGDPRIRIRKFAQTALTERLQIKTDRKDFISYIVRHNDERGMSTQEIGMTLKTFLNAGSETTATTMTAAVWILLRHQDVLKKVQEEVRTSFGSSEKITMLSATAGSLPYLAAALSETMRVYTTVPVLFPRKTDKGTVIDGHLVPTGTVVGVHQYAVYHASKNFTRPDEFLPERFMHGAGFESDCIEAFQPFSVGPRACIGRNLAQAEMMLLMARLIFQFNIELCEESANWGVGQKTTLFWQKPPLMVRFSRAQEST